jgi:hypothetical protein
MRLWSLHPKYLDARGLVALWREALLAQAVLRGRTRGYRNHPQLERFRRHATPLAALAVYLAAVHEEATRRSYRFRRSKFRIPPQAVTLSVSSGQLRYEWTHLMKKLRRRNPAAWRKWYRSGRPVPHPIFKVRRGRVESWERTL